MRLRRLDLARYGKFTDQTIDFGPVTDGSPDLHIVYGPNEAGKSTAFSGFLDLLYGIEARSRYDFIHPYPTMRIGAVLETAEGSRQFVRIKRPQNSLLDENDRPLSEAVLPAALAGIDRSAYRTMFSLDDETLEAGGESILASKGDLGQLLFSASAGLADLARNLTDIGSEAEKFYKLRARNHELGALKERLTELKAERARIDTLATDHARLVDERDRALTRYEEALATRGQTAAKIDSIRRHLNALPRLASLRTTRARLEPLASLPDAPHGWAEELPELQRAGIELATRAESIASEIATQMALVEAITVDDAVLQLANRIGRLADLRARHITAEKDLPERRLQRGEQEASIAGILRLIEREGEADPARLVLGASVTGPLRDLIEARSGIDTAIASASDELANARLRVEAASDNLNRAADGQQGAEIAPAALANLVAVSDILRGSDFALRLRLAQRARDDAGEVLEERLGELHPWKGDSRDLAQLPVPSPVEITTWKTALTDIRKQIDGHFSEQERLETEQTRLNAELQSIAGTGGVASDGDAAQARNAREQAWAEHRRKLDATSAESFEAALRHDDLVTGGRIGQMATLERLRQLDRALKVAEADNNRVTAVLKVAHKALETTNGEIATSLWMLAPLPATMPLPRFEAWLERREKALEAAGKLRQAEKDHDAITADIAAIRERLANALDIAGFPQTADIAFETMQATARTIIERETTLETLRATLVERAQELASREHGLKTANDADQRWQQAWGAACAACWLGEGESLPAMATVREVLGAISNLGPAIEKSAGLADRIMKMEQDQHVLRAEVVAVLEALDEASDTITTSGAALDAADTLAARLREAGTDRDRRDAASERLEKARETQRDITGAMARHGVRQGEMTAFFAVQSLHDVGARLGDISRRKELAAQAEEAEREICDMLRVASIEAAESLLVEADATALEAEMTELQARFDVEDERTRQLFSENAKASDRLEDVGGDGAVARLEEERRTVLLDIEERATHYLRLRLGAAAATQALGLYRDQHRGAMLTRASEAFRTMSRGAYVQLATQPGSNGDSLIAISADGRSLQVSNKELSKGTLFQLYLALRLAGYHEFARLRSPVPFIADDIMETFDDLRSQEVFRLFADMAQTGQVIYLTHHQHLCDMALRVCPQARLHLLGDAQGQPGL